MADAFLITPYKVRSAGTDVPPEEVQTAINSLAQQTTIALNSVASDPTGPAGGDLGGTYPNPTVTGSHITSGTMSGVAITTGSINNTPIGATTPSTGAFTTATAGSLFASGGAVPVVTATGTQVYNSPNPTVQFIDSIRSAGNKNAFVTWGSTVLAFGFANDAFTSFTNALTITGGFTAGVSGITSTSGTGAWAHTGGFSATGGMNSTTVGATTPSTGAFTTLTATTPVGVASGGTGAATLTAHGVLIGEGTAAVAATAVGTTGQMLLGVTGADPAFGNNPTITGGTINSATVGATTPSTGAFTTLSSTGNFTPSQTNGIIGTTTNNNANAGSVGEYVISSVTGVSATSGVSLNVTSISLTAGDWEVAGSIAANPATNTVLNTYVFSSSTVSATNDVIPFRTQDNNTQPTANAYISMPIPEKRYSLSAPATVYLVATAVFTVSTLTVDGYIRARRVR